MNHDEEKQFRHILLHATAEAKKLGYRPNEFEKMIERDGPFATVKRIVPKKDPSDGFFRLYDLGRVDLTCEAIIVETPWRSYFDVDLLTLAENRLTAFKYAWKPYSSNSSGLKGGSPAEDVTSVEPDLSDKIDDDFVPPEMDNREREMREGYLRPGQAKFRNSLFQIYGTLCCITGCTVAEAIEAAHISAYRGEAFNHVQNGLLMRADVHSLFDRYLLSIDPTSLRVVLSEKLKANAFYRELADVRLNIDGAIVKPSKRAIDMHWRTFANENVK